MEIDNGQLIQMQPIFIIRDSDFNLLQKHIYADTTTYSINRFERIMPIQGGGWVAVGRSTTKFDSDAGFVEDVFSFTERFG